MSGFVLTTVSNNTILAQTTAPAQGAATSATQAEKKKTPKTPTTTTPATSTGMPDFNVKPDFGQLQGASTGAQTGINLLAAILIAVLVIAFIAGLISVIVGKVADMPHWATRGKAALIGAPVLALLGSMAAQIIGWGWTLGG